MDIIGNGFLAHHLRPLEGAYPQVVTLAAGVPLPQNTAAAYDRETALVDATIDRCRHDGRTLVFFSTAAAGMYGNSSGIEDEPFTPADEYGRKKRTLEERIRRSGVRHLLLRLTYIVGSHCRPDRLIPALVGQIRSGRVTVYQGAMRDLLDVTDFVRILDGLLRADVGQEIVNVASGQSVPIASIVDHLEARLGMRAERTYVDVDAPHRVSVAKLSRLLPDLMDFAPDYYRTVIDRYLDA
ncbi:NAD-dependent epimerase/dehydratase family protein [Nonomuraea polychroma]|uniref:NAD-dependent epimerase/dehydratase family protein n=1 Tax=Nonomuraea polychroma TaxID=46176 RepID=UPI003D8BA0B0